MVLILVRGCLIDFRDFLSKKAKIIIDTMATKMYGRSCHELEPTGQPGLVEVKITVMPIMGVPIKKSRKMT